MNNRTRFDMSNRIFAVALILASLACWHPQADAQVNEKFADMASEIELLRSVAQTERKAIVAKSMILTDEEATAFWPVYNEYRAAISRANDRLVALITDYAAQRDTLSDAQAKALLNNYMRLDRDLLKVRKKYIGRFGKILPATKVARFYQIENKLDILQNMVIASQIPLVR